MDNSKRIFCFFTEYQESLVLDGAGEIMALLDDGDRERYQRYTHSEKKAELLVSRLLVKSVAARIADVGLRDVILSSESSGKPRMQVKGHDEKNLPSFSVAHTHGLVAVAFYRYGEVGVDAEDMLDTRRHLEAIARRFFSEDEKQYFQEGDGDTSAGRFFTLWTLKESIAKLSREGVIELLKENLVEKGRVLDTKDGKHLESRVVEDQYCFGFAVKGEKPGLPVHLESIPYARLHANLHS